MEPDAALPLIGRLRTTVRATFASLGHRNFRLYFIGQVVSNTGNWLTNVALTLLVLERTHSGLAIGILAACQYGPILLLSAYGGVVADRYSKRRMLLITQTLEMAESVGLAVLAFLPHTATVSFYILATLGGTLLAFDNPLRRSFVSEMVPSKSVSNAVVLYSIIVNTSRVIGPALAGLLVVTLGYGWAFTVDAFSYLAVIACLLLMRSSELHRLPPRPRQKGEIRAGLAYVRRTPVLLVSFTMLLIIGTLVYNFSTTLPLFVSKGLHASNTTYTVLYSLMGVGSIITALIIARRNLVRLRHIIAGAGILGVSMALMAIAPNVYVAAPLAIFVGAGTILYTTATTSLAQLTAADYIRGRVLALQTVLLIGTTPLGSPLLGWLADSLGGRAPILLGSAVCLLTAVGGYIWARQLAAKRI
ncbi:MAG TPA: MFS transporter [Candidatus Saccharimonadales bacterium]|nr:MFS transporter [Candidatus Saccharimonadales bacterium]